MISELLDERHTTPLRVCCICLDDCEETAVMQSPIDLLPCSCKDIVVHKECFDTWFGENRSCPICRTKIRRIRGPHSNPSNDSPNDCPKSYVIAGMCVCVISVNLLAWLVYSVYNNTNTDQNNADNSDYNGFLNGK